MRWPFGWRRACRNVIQAVLREEEWAEADREFYLVIKEGIEQALNARRPP